MPVMQVFRELGVLVDATPIHQVYVSAAVWDLLRQGGAAGEAVSCGVPAFRLASMPPGDVADLPVQAQGELEVSLELAPEFQQALMSYLPEPVVQCMGANHEVGSCGTAGTTIYHHCEGPPPFSDRSSITLVLPSLHPQAWLAENRSVAAVFLKLPTLHSGSFLLAQAVMVQIQMALIRHGGMLRQASDSNSSLSPPGSRSSRDGRSLLSWASLAHPSTGRVFFFFFPPPLIRPPIPLHPARQFLTDDKGTVAILVWGCPPAAHVDDSARAVRATLELRATLTQVRAMCSS